MSKPYFLTETSRAPSDRDPGKRVLSWVSRWIQPLRASVARVNQAQIRRCELASLPQNMLSDTGLSPDDATGIASHQPDLPFFMQDRFGRH